MENSSIITDLVESNGHMLLQALALLTVLLVLKMLRAWFNDGIMPDLSTCTAPDRSWLWDVLAVGIVGRLLGFTFGNLGWFLASMVACAALAAMVCCLGLALFMLWSVAAVFVTIWYLPAFLIMAALGLWLHDITSK